MPHAKADEFQERRQDASRLKFKPDREFLLRRIRDEEDVLLGSDEKIEGKRVPYGSTTDTEQNAA